MLEAIFIAIMVVESGLCAHAHNLDEDAVGILQIRPIYVEDVNRILGYKCYSLEDRWDVQKSRDMMYTYTMYWYHRYKPECSIQEAIARIHNGGPRGWMKESTKDYWRKVMIHLESLIIEVTRRCNLCCEHCLRGESEEVDIWHTTLLDLFRQLEGSNINNLSFSGGEPSLVPSKIIGAIEYAEMFAVEVENFYIATNAVHISEDFLIALHRLWEYCSSNETSQIHYSNSDYHYDGYDAHKLEIFGCYAKKYNSPQETIIKQGRAKDWGNRVLKDYSNEIVQSNGHIHVYDTLYVNVNGDVINGCDWSYEEQPAHKLCDVDNLVTILLEVDNDRV